MAAPCRIEVSLQEDDFDAGREIAALTTGRTDIGAVVTFSGLCRDEGRRLAALELEHYPGMAEAEISRIAEQAAARWPLIAIRVIHRFGVIKAGANIVLVVTASSHRQAAFEAASFVMDFLKTDAPFWKKEHPVAGDAGIWVDARISDDEATARWKRTD